VEDNEFGAAFSWKSHGEEVDKGKKRNATCHTCRESRGIEGKEGRLEGSPQGKGRSSVLHVRQTSWG